MDSCLCKQLYNFYFINASDFGVCWIFWKFCRYLNSLQLYLEMCKNGWNSVNRLSPPLPSLPSPPPPNATFEEINDFLKKLKVLLHKKCNLLKECVKNRWNSVNRLPPSPFPSLLSSPPLPMQQLKKLMIFWKNLKFCFIKNAIYLRNV